MPSQYNCPLRRSLYVLQNVRKRPTNLAFLFSTNPKNPKKKVSSPKITPIHTRKVSEERQKSKTFRKLNTSIRRKSIFIISGKSPEIGKIDCVKLKAVNSYKKQDLLMDNSKKKVNETLPLKRSHLRYRSTDYFREPIHPIEEALSPWE